MHCKRVRGIPDPLLVFSGVINIHSTKKKKKKAQICYPDDFLEKNGDSALPTGEPSPRGLLSNSMVK